MSCVFSFLVDIETGTGVHYATAKLSFMCESIESSCHGDDRGHCIVWCSSLFLHGVCSTSGLTIKRGH